MKKALLLVFFLSSSIHIHAQETPAQSCVRDLDAIPAFMLANDAGGKDEMAQKGQKRFDDALAAARADAAKIATDNECFAVLTKYLLAWRDGHLWAQYPAPKKAENAVPSTPQPGNHAVLKVLSEKTLLLTLPDFEASVWSSLAELYQRQERVPDAIHANEAVLRLSSAPAMRLQAMINLGGLYHTVGRDAAAEQQWLAALAIDPKESLIWFSLADLYQKGGRRPQAIHALQQAIPLSADPTVNARAQVQLARLYLMNHQPDDALRSLDAAEHTAPADLLAERTGRSFSFDIAQGRAAAWAALGDLKQATSFEEQAVKLDPDAPDAWQHLAKLYQRQGRVADQQRAENSSKTLLTGTQ